MELRHGKMSNTNMKLTPQSFVVICALSALCGCHDGASGLAGTQAVPAMAIQQAAMAPGAAPKPAVRGVKRDGLIEPSASVCELRIVRSVGLTN